MTATVQTSIPATSTGTEASIAEAFVHHLPGAPLMAQRHTGEPVPTERLASGVSVTYVGGRSADLAVILLDTSELPEAAGVDPALLRLGDVLRPALEQAGAVLGEGLLGDAVEGAQAALFASAEAEVFDLMGERGLAGWFAVLVRGAVSGAQQDVDVTSRLGRISGVEMTLSVEIGRARVSVRELLSVQPGTVIELDRAVGAQADVLLNGRLIAHGEIVVIDQQFGLRVTEVLDRALES